MVTIAPGIDVAFMVELAEDISQDNSRCLLVRWPCGNLQEGALGNTWSKTTWSTTMGQQKTRLHLKRNNVPNTTFVSAG